MTIGKKDGLATKDEIKVLWGIASGEIKMPAMLRPIAAAVVPGFIDGLDNRFGDRIPEPWQSHLETMVTLVVEAVEDKVITKEEIEGVLVYIAKVVDEKIDIKFLDEDTEAMVFLQTSKLLASLIYSSFKKQLNLNDGETAQG